MGKPLLSRALLSRAEGRPDSAAFASHSKSALQVVKVVIVMKPCSQPCDASRTCHTRREGGLRTCWFAMAAWT